MLKDKSVTLDKFRNAYSPMKLSVYEYKSNSVTLAP